MSTNETRIARKQPPSVLRAWRQMKARIVSALEQDAAPRPFALGTAIGVFMAMVPLIGFQALLALALASALRASRLAAAASVFVANPLFFYLDYLIGRVVLEKLGAAQFQPLELSWNNFAGQLTRQVLVPALVGSPILGLACGAMAYFAALLVVHNRKSQPIRTECS